jgi:hypothetical protein
MEGANQPFKRPATVSAAASAQNPDNSNVSAEEARIGELIANQAQLEEQNRMLIEQVARGQQIAQTSQAQTAQVLEQNRALTVTITEQNSRASQLQASLAVQTEIVQPGAAAAAAAGGAAGAATQLSGKLLSEKAIRKVTTEHIEKVKDAQIQINVALAAKAGLQTATIDVGNPGAPLPDGVPNKVKALRSPKLGATKELLLHEGFMIKLAAHQETCEKALRVFQKACVDTGVLVRNDILAYYRDVKDETKSDAALQTAVVDMLRDTDIPDATKKDIVAAASRTFRDERSLAIAGVNIKRNEAADQAAEKHARDEEARLKLLSENNDKTVGAIVDSKLAEYIRTGGADGMEETDPAALAAANAAHQKQLAPSNFGGATRAPKAQSKGKGKSKGKGDPQKTKTPEHKAQGRGKGKGKNKGGGGRGANKRR